MPDRNSAERPGADVRFVRHGATQDANILAMNIELSNEELLVFCGLARLLVRLDGRFSTEEREVLETIGPELAVRSDVKPDPYREGPSRKDDGVDRFWRAMDEAARAFPDGEAVRRRASDVTRPGARQAIHAALFALAASDTIEGNEWALLEWLASEWDLEDAGA